MIQATWKLTGYYKADANLVAQEIVRIENATPQNILEVAKNPESELHKCFTWDDTVAAEKWRLCEARKVVCNLVIAKKEEKQEPTNIRMFYKTDSKGYKPTTLIINNEDEYQALLRRAYEELRNFKKKYSTLNELQEIFDLIENL